MEWSLSLHISVVWPGSVLLVAQLNCSSCFHYNIYNKQFKFKVVKVHFVISAWTVLSTEGIWREEAKYLYEEPMELSIQAWSLELLNSTNSSVNRIWWQWHWAFHRNWWLQEHFCHQSFIQSQHPDTPETDNDIFPIQSRTNSLHKFIKMGLKAGQNRFISYVETTDQTWCEASVQHWASWTYYIHTLFGHLSGFRFL